MYRYDMTRYTTECQFITVYGQQVRTTLQLIHCQLFNLGKESLIGVRFAFVQ